MAYLDTRPRASVGSMAAVLAVHGGLAALLVLGLTVTGVIAPKPERLVNMPFRDPPPPPPPQPRPSEPVAKVQPSDPVIPQPPRPLPNQGPVIDAAPRLPDALPPMPTGSASGSGTGETVLPATPRPTASFEPVGARPRTDPSGWVTADDYRSAWIRQDMTGKARFRLDIAADGRVTGCTITGTSGHAALDQATCALVTRRARFQPARGTDGAPVAGTYTNAIDWQLPD